MVAIILPYSLPVCKACTCGQVLAPVLPQVFQNSRGQMYMFRFKILSETRPVVYSDSTDRALQLPLLQQPLPIPLLAQYWVIETVWLQHSECSSTSAAACTLHGVVSMSFMSRHLSGRGSYSQTCQCIVALVHKLVHLHVLMDNLRGLYNTTT